MKKTNNQFMAIIKNILIIKNNKLLNMNQKIKNK